jgi:hypothetical protein
MQRLTKADIVGEDEYERMRPEFRRRVMVQKDKRRVRVGDHCTLHFENRDTMRYQVHEMLRAEASWTRPGAIDAELEAYNALIPDTGELSATMMLEYESARERALMLPRFAGIDQHVWLQIGGTAPILAGFDHGQIGARKVSSVQYVKFRLSGDRIEALQIDGTVARIVIDHPAYRAQAVLSEETRKTIARDPV